MCGFVYFFTYLNLNDMNFCLTHIRLYSQNSREGSISPYIFDGQLIDIVITSVCPTHLLNDILLVRSRLC